MAVGKDKNNASVIALHAETWSTPLVIEGSAYATIVAADRCGYLSSFRGDTLDKIWCVDLGTVITASPTPVKLNQSKTEIIIGTEDGRIFSISSQTGDITWSAKCGTCVRSTAAIATLTDKAVVYVSGYGAWMYCFDAATGAVIWKRYLPKPELFRGTKAGVVSSPLVADVDLDGELEVVTGTRSRRIYCMSAKTGKFKWFYETDYDPDSSPSFAVVEGIPLVLIGGGEHTSGKGDNSVYALHGNDGKIHWRTKVNGGLDSSPIVADINGDGELEVVITSLADASCYALKASSGQIIWRYKFGPTPGCVHDANNICRRSVGEAYYTGSAVCRSYTTPLVTDLNNDGSIEVVVGSNNGKLVVIDGSTGVPEWWQDTEGMVRGSPVLADINGSGQNELIVCSGSRIIIYHANSIGPSWPMFKGEANHSGWINTSRVNQTENQLQAQRLFWIKLVWCWLIKDGFRYFLFQFDRRVLRHFGLKLLDYYY